ncbi:hypothetical protein FRC03_001849 [Tulasnella sp. 419]|nr:hypothetical protein FRC03_001849 [Tulasnella sp. 419]
MSSSYQEDLADANKGFDAVFNDDIELGKSILNAGNTPFHLLGLGVVTFLQAALGMEDGIMAEASKALTEAQAAAKQAYKVAQSKPSATRFPAGTEWELLQTDTILLLGVTQVLSESYMGYVQCLYSLNSAHGRFSKAFKMVFPSGLDAYPTPAASPAVSRKPSTATLSTISSQSGAGASSRNVSTPSSSKGSIFSRLTGMSSSTSLTVPSTPTVIHPEGPIEELIVYGSAFGFGLFSLVFSLLPAKIKRLVGFLGFQSDRQLALQALAVSAAGKGKCHLKTTL